MQQLTFIPENKEDSLINEIMQLREKVERIRKGQYAKIAHLTKLYDTLSYQMNILNSALCNYRPSEQVLESKISYQSDIT